MNTLRQLGEFVGIPQDSGEFGAPIPPIGLRLVSRLLAPVSTPQQRASMRAMIALLRTLPPVSLEAQLLNPGGREPYAPVIRVSSSPGLVISTRIHFIESGREFPPSENFGAAGGDFSPTHLGPGQWEVVVWRAGISSTGYTRLSKSFRTNVTGGGPPPPPQAQPTIFVDFSGTLTEATFTVTGSGFLSNLPGTPTSGVAIRVVDANVAVLTRREHTRTNNSGEIDQAIRGDLSDVVINGLGVGTLAFSATDGRPGLNEEFLWSNTARINFTIQANGSLRWWRS